MEVLYDVQLRVWSILLRLPSLRVAPSRRRCMTILKYALGVVGVTLFYGAFFALVLTGMRGGV